VRHGGKFQQLSTRHQRRDPLGDRERGDEIAAAGNHRCGPAEIRHLGGQVVWLVLESHLLRPVFTFGHGRVEREAVGFGGVVEFTERDAAHQVFLVAIRQVAQGGESG
jgi:hypothetical protein